MHLCRCHDDHRRLLRLVEPLARQLNTIEMKERRIMATIDDANAKLAELVKDVQRVLALVKNAPAAAATQAQVDQLNERLDALDTEVETASPEEPTQ